MKMEHKRVFVVVLAVAVLLMPMTAFGASNPYKDVTKKTVGKHGVTVVKYIKKHHGYEYVVKGKKFHPNRKITRGEFLVVLTNFYGHENVEISSEDEKKWNNTISARDATSKMVDVASKIGISISWDDNGSKPLSRILCSKYIYNFAVFDSAFRPKN